MAERKNPTNADLLKEIKAVKKEVGEVIADVTDLKTWRRDQEIARTAVEEYKRTEKTPSDSKQTKDVVKQLLLALGAVVAALVVITQGGGK